MVICKGFEYSGGCACLYDKFVNKSAISPIGKELFEKEQDNLLAYKSKMIQVVDDMLGREIS